MTWKRVITLNSKRKLSQKLLTKRQKALRANLYIYSNVLLDALHIDNKMKQEMLFERFGKWSRKQLTIDELESFVNYLEQKRDKNR